jgi:hypothetical protein
MYSTGMGQPPRLGRTQTTEVDAFDGGNFAWAWGLSVKAVTHAPFRVGSQKRHGYVRSTAFERACRSSLHVRLCS